MDILDPVTFYNILTFAISFTIVILGVMLLVLYIDPDKSLDNLRFARNYLAVSYFILGMSSLINFFTQSETDNVLLMEVFILVIASYQALLFTYTILALIQPLCFRQKIMYIQLGIVSVAGVFLFLTLFFCPYFFYKIFYYVAVLGYLLQITYYTHIFRLRYNACLQSLEEYYEEDERNRLRWVSISFYGALAIGVLALISLFQNLYFYICFSIVYTVYYAYMVSRVYNYQINFKFAIRVVTQSKIVSDELVNKQESLYSADEIEAFRIMLNKWVEDKSFIQKDISVDEIAELLGVNRSFLQYYFRIYIQTDFRTWRSELRICEAQNVLKENPEISLEELRKLVGFNHRANFHQQFQKITGLTPTQYRQQQSKLI